MTENVPLSCFSHCYFGLSNDSQTQVYQCPDTKTSRWPCWDNVAIAGMGLDVYAQPLKWPRSLEGLLKCRFATLISLEGPGICIFNRCPWRLTEIGHRAHVERWWASDTESLSRDGFPAIRSPPSAPKVLFTVLPARHLPRHTLTATPPPRPCAGLLFLGSTDFL